MVEDKNTRLAREHGQRAEDYAKQAGQHTASAASTVGHDLRAAGEQVVEAGKYVGARLTAPIEGEDARDKARNTVENANKHAHAKADEAADVTKSTYDKIKDSIGGFFGGAKDSADRHASAAADEAGGAAHKAANVVNRGMDKAHEGQRSVYESTPSQGEVRAQGKEALDTAKDAAIQTKDAVVGAASYVGGRLTAPVSGKEEEDRRLKEEAKDKTRRAADYVSGSAQSAKDSSAEAAEHAKEQGKGLFASIKDAFSAPADTRPIKEHHESMGEKAQGAMNSVQDQAKGAYHNVQDKVTNSVEDAKRQMREAAEAAEPKNHTEAVLSEGGIPSNTADLLKQRESSGSADQAAHESMQGQHIGVEGLLDKTAEAWGGDHLTGDGNLDSVRNAADAAGPHSTHR